MLQTQLGLISPAAFAGYPIVSVPGGFPADTGRPVNITFVGRRFSEAKLLGFAYAYEQATKHRRPPSEVNPATLALRDRRPRSAAARSPASPGR